MATHHGYKTLPIFVSGLQTFLFVGFTAFFFLNEARVLRTTKEDAARSEHPEGLTEFLVEIDVKSGETSLGHDRGVLYFEKGLMGFVGSSTSFLLAEEDIVQPKGPVLVNWDRLFRPLRLRVEDEKSAVTIKPLLGYGRPYRKALKAFLLEKKVTDAERQWPPTLKWGQEPEPEKPVETWTPPPVPASDLSHLDCEPLEERAQLALRLGYVGEYQRVRDELETRAGV